VGYLLGLGVLSGPGQCPSDLGQRVGLQVPMADRPPYLLGLAELAASASPLATCIRACPC
jgi:hypothetical protein